jgi:hypothetical protein
MGREAAPVWTETRTSNPFVVDGNDIVIINCTTKDVPDGWAPENMSDNKFDLLNRWNAILQICLYALERKETVRTGWVFSTRALAVHKRTAEHGDMILLNPVKLNGNRYVGRYQNNKESFWTLVSLAIHEITHIDWSYHGEDYANALTTNMGKVFQHVSKLQIASKF